MLAYTTESIFQLRLPASNDQTSLLHIIADIRDTFRSVIEFNLQPITVLPNFQAITELINMLEQPNNHSNANLLNELLRSGDQNTIEQIVTSISQVFNEKNNENIIIAGRSKHSSVKN